MLGLAKVGRGGVYEEEANSGCGNLIMVIHSNLPNIMLGETDVHVILRRFVVLTWMRDNKGSMLHVTLRNNTKSTLQ